MERELLGPLREVFTVIDTSLLRPAQLRTWVRHIVGAEAAGLTLVFESFAYKHGVPMDADFVFDVRMLPNPFYLKELKPLTGRDQPVIDYLNAQPESAELLAQIETFLCALAAHAGERSAQLCDRGDGLHRRSAPLGVLRGAVGQALCGPRGRPVTSP